MYWQRLIGITILGSMLVLSACGSAGQTQTGSNDNVVQAAGKDEGTNSKNEGTKLKDETKQPKESKSNDKAKKRKNEGKKSKVMKRPTVSFDQLSGQYKKIAKTAANYELPTEGRLPKDNKLYNTVAEGSVVFENGYVFRGKTVTQRIYLHDKKPIPTPEQYLGMIMGFWRDFSRIMTLEGVKDFHRFNGNFEDLPKEGKQDVLYGWWHPFQGDIEHKLDRLNELKHYSSDYPALDAIIHETIDLLQKAKNMDVTTKDDLKKAYGYYEKAAKKIKKTGQAFYAGVLMDQ